VDSPGHCFHFSCGIPFGHIGVNLIFKSPTQGSVGKRTKASGLFELNNSSRKPAMKGKLEFGTPSFWGSGTPFKKQPSTAVSHNLKLHKPEPSDANFVGISWFASLGDNSPHLIAPKTWRPWTPPGGDIHPKPHKPHKLYGPESSDQIFDGLSQKMLRKRGAVSARSVPTSVGYHAMGHGVGNSFEGLKTDPFSASMNTNALMKTSSQYHSQNAPQGVAVYYKKYGRRVGAG